MKSKTKSSFHGKLRIHQRLNTNYRTNTLVKIVSKNGKSKGMYDGKFYQYLCSKSKSGARVKVYKDNIYILSKNTKRLITTYKVPDKYLPLEQYELKEEKVKLFNKVNSYVGKCVIVKLNDNTEIVGFIKREHNVYISNVINIVNDNRYTIKYNDIESISLKK